MILGHTKKWSPYEGFVSYLLVKKCLIILPLFYWIAGHTKKWSPYKGFISYLLVKKCVIILPLFYWIALYPMLSIVGIGAKIPFTFFQTMLKSHVFYSCNINYTIFLILCTKSCYNKHRAQHLSYKTNPITEPLCIQHFSIIVSFPSVCLTI